MKDIYENDEQSRGSNKTAKIIRSTASFFSHRITAARCLTFFVVDLVTNQYVWAMTTGLWPTGYATLREPRMTGG